MKYIDLSHTISDGMVTFKDLPGPLICDYPGREASRKYYTQGTGLERFVNLPVHTTLLADEILIVEHLRGLERLPDEPFRFSAVPRKISGMGTFPVRAFASLLPMPPPPGG